MSKWMVKCPITSVKRNSGGDKLLNTLKKKRDQSFRQQLQKRPSSSFGFLVAIMFKDEFLFVFLSPVAVSFQEIHLLIGSQSFVNIAVLLFTRTIRLVKLFVTITCFTLCSIKAWCTAAVESVQSVCAGPVVLTGMICTIIDIYFKVIGQKVNNGRQNLQRSKTKLNNKKYA